MDDFTLEGHPLAEYPVSAPFDEGPVDLGSGAVWPAREDLFAAAEGPDGALLAAVDEAPEQAFQEAYYDGPAAEEEAQRPASAPLGVEVAELVELWDAALALNERIRQLVVRHLVEQPGRPPLSYENASAYAYGYEQYEQEYPPAPAHAPAFEEETPERQTVIALIGKGSTENEITNEVFYLRNPALRGRPLKANSKEARQWSAIRATEVRPLARSLIDTSAVDPVELAMFFSQYESDDRVPDSITRQFLTGSPLLSMGRSLRDLVLRNWNAGGAPLTLDGLYHLAYDLTGHPATAMLLCHNVTKAFARGGTAITWDRHPSAPDTYSDGRRIWTPKVIHPAGKLLRNKRDQPVIFYLLYSAKELGTTDWGDWYHYYVAATMAAYGGGGALTPGSSREAESLAADVLAHEERGGRVKDAVVAMVYPDLVREQVLNMERQMTNPDLHSAPGYRGWVLANVMSFLEGGHYGTDQAEVDRESRFHVRGAVMGLRVSGAKPGKGWVWYVPVAGSISKQDLLVGFNLRYRTAKALDSAGKPLVQGKQP